VKLLIYSFSELKEVEGVGNVALNISKFLLFDQTFLSLGKHQKVLFYSFLSLFYFAFKVFKTKPDVVLVHSVEASFDPVVARKLFGFKYKIVSIAHGTYFGLLKEYEKEIAFGNAKPKLTFILNLKISIFRGRFVKYCDAVTAVSSVAKSDVKLFYGVDSIVIPNGVEDEFFKMRSNKTKVNMGRILFVGNHFWLKGLHYLIKANSILLNPKKIVAVGIDEGQIKELRGLVDCKEVEFKKLLSRKDLIKEYVKGGIFAMPSVYESFGIVYLEAMCLGMPVIASKGTGVEDFIIEGKNGFLVEKRNPKSIAEAIIKAEKLCGKVPKPESKYLWKNISKQYAKVMQDVLKGKV